MVVTDEQLSSIILQNNILDQAGLDGMLEFAKSSQISLSDALIEKDVISDEKLGTLIATFLKVPFIVLSRVAIPPEILKIVPERLARKHNVIAFGRDQTGIKLAMINPFDKDIIAMISKKTGSPVIPHLTTERDFFNTLHLYRKELQKTVDELLAEQVKVAQNSGENDAPVAKIVDLLIDYAYQDKASDVHIEPQESISLVRFRIDGILHDILFLPKNLHERVTTRIKVLSRLRTDEHMSAQDGKMRLPLQEENLDIRVSIVPIVEGEKVVLRLLSARFRQFSLLNLGMSQNDLEKINRAIKKSYGMILSTGPTGSGKTTSIYSILKILNSREKNITTIEDPVEYRIKGVNQIQVNVKTDLTFANGLRSILRQDPNIVFVGEIRDTETAGIAVNAALTGHLVVSTLHTNDAATALPRLIDMKVEPFLVASTVNVIIAQRLVREICDTCKAAITMNRDEIVKNLPAELIDKHLGNGPTIQAYMGKGCKVCHSTGYTGRIGVFEVLEVTENVRKLITEKEDSDVITREAIKEGMMTMLDDGLDKVAKGMTTLEEVLRVTKVESL